MVRKTMKAIVFLVSVVGCAILISRYAPQESVPSGLTSEEMKALHARLTQLSAEREACERSAHEVQKQLSQTTAELRAAKAALAQQDSAAAALEQLRASSIQKIDLLQQELASRSSEQQRLVTDQKRSHAELNDSLTRLESAHELIEQLKSEMAKLQHDAAQTDAELRVALERLAERPPADAASAPAAAIANTPAPKPTEPNVNPKVLVEYTFNTDDQGWRVSGGPFGGATPPRHQSGQIAAEGKGPFSWQAPSSIHGDFSQAYGGRLSFDRVGANMRAGGVYAGLVRLSGGGLSVIYRARRKADASMVSYSVQLDASEAWYVEGTDRRATEADLHSVLGTLTGVSIQGHPNSITYGRAVLDNVRIVAR